MFSDSTPEQLAEAQRKAEEARETANKLREEADAARKDLEVKNKTTESNAAPSKIQRPRTGEMPEGQNRLRKAMGLENDKATYLAIQVSKIQRRC